MTNAVWDYMYMAFPADLTTIDHVTINSFAKRQLALRKGVSATMMPKIIQQVMRFKFDNFDFLSDYLKFSDEKSPFYAFCAFLRPYQYCKR